MEVRDKQVDHDSLYLAELIHEKMTTVEDPTETKQMTALVKAGAGTRHE